MKAILSYHPSCGLELLTFENGKEVLKNDCWLINLINDKYKGNKIVFLGRDDKKRVEIEMGIGLFSDIQHDPMFIMKAEKLRRLRTTRVNFLDYLVNSNFNLIDNDLDKEVN